MGRGAFANPHPPWSPPSGFEGFWICSHRNTQVFFILGRRSASTVPAGTESGRLPLNGTHCTGTSTESGSLLPLYGNLAPNDGCPENYSVIRIRKMGIIFRKMDEPKTAFIPLYRKFLAGF